MPRIIGVAGVSGAGKTTLVRALGEFFDNATCLFWDDYEDFGIFPNDYVDWYASCKDYSAWKTPLLAEILLSLKQKNATCSPVSDQFLEPTSYIFYDSPLGYAHYETGQFIDFLIYLDTPLDICLARRLIRDFTSRKDQIIEELELYLKKSRPLFVDDDIKSGANFHLDGKLSMSAQLKKIRNEIEKQGIIKN